MHYLCSAGPVLAPILAPLRITPWVFKLKQLFTAQAFVLSDFLDAATCKRWEKTVLGHLEVFGPDVDPVYGQMAAYYGMVEAGLNESYYRFADQHNQFLLHHFPEIPGIIARVGALILDASGLDIAALPIVPRDSKYFLLAGFNLQLHDWPIYNLHTDTEGLLLYPSSIFDIATRAYSCVISIKRTAQHTRHRGGDLDIWQERFLADELEQFYRKDRIHARTNKQRLKVSYEPGNMVLFDSFMPHVVRPFQVRSKADRRISFVMHFNYRTHTERNPLPHLEYWY